MQLSSADTAWYVVQCRTNQNERARENLENQGIVCINPLLRVERIVRGKRSLCEEALFPGYVFVQLEKTSCGWHTIRSTRGAQKLVAFGGHPAAMPAGVMTALLQRCETHDKCSSLTFSAGDKLRIIDGPFANFDAVFHRFDGQERVIVLLNMLNKQQQLTLNIKQVDKNQ